MADYKQAQLIAYTCPTLAITEPGSARATLPPVRALTDDDEKARVQRMYDVAEWVHAKAAWTKSDDVLKVFIAPEFYFRPNNAGKAYTFNRMINIIGALKELFKGDKWANWLLVPGTIFSALPADAKGGALNVGTGVSPTGTLENAYVNTCVIVKGGPSGSLHYVHKRRVSHIDGAPQYEAVGLNPTFSPLVEDWKELKQRMFKIDNIDFGIDICLDHYQAQLKNVLWAWKGKEGTDAPVVKIHLVTSCGAQVQAPAAVAKVGGWVFHCDGIKNPDPWDVTTLMQVKGFNWNGPSLLAKVDPTWTQDVPAQLRVPAPSQGAYTDHVRMYAPVAVPA